MFGGGPFHSVNVAVDIFISVPVREGASVRGTMRKTSNTGTLFPSGTWRNSILWYPFAAAILSRRALTPANISFPAVCSTQIEFFAANASQCIVDRRRWGIV